MASFIPTRSRVLLVAAALLLPATVTAAVTLPLEVMGVDGTTREARVDAPDGSSAVGLWLQVHGLTYQDKGSIQVNASAWIPLRNSDQAIDIAEPGKGYGGIGGGFQTLKLTVRLPAGSVVDGSNTIRFRFNQTDGRSMGFRVLDFNLVDGSGRQLVPASAFVTDDPSQWTAPRPAAADIAAGRELWQDASLVESPLDSRTIQAGCMDCHAHDGRDLKYFNYSNHSIIERSKFHGLSQEDGERIASYIRSLDQPAPGRPWNPPYQPGPGLDDQPVEEWSAGAGLEWVLDDDAGILPHLPGAGVDKAAHVDENRHVLNYNRRVIPLSMQFLDWNHWLPEVHPMDAIGSETFTAHGAWTIYLRIRDGLAGRLEQSREDYVADQLRGDLDRWQGHINGDDSRITRLYQLTGHATTLENYRQTYAAGLWSLVKQWEIMQEFRLEELGEQFYGVHGEQRQWHSNRHIFNLAPHIISNDDTRDKLVVGDHSPQRMFDYLSDVWYEMNLILSPGNRNATKGGHHNNDWKYLWYFTGAGHDQFQPLQGLALSWKSIQEMDHGWGPEGRSRNPSDNSWWGFTLRDARPELGRVLSHDWPGYRPEEVKPILQPMYTTWVEKLSTFTLEQWAQSNTNEFNRPADYVWGSSDVNESYPDIMRGELGQMRDTYDFDHAVINGYASWGRFLWPLNDWDQYLVARTTSLAAPVGVSASSDVNSSTIRWQAVSGATSYNVLRAFDPDGDYLPAGLLVEGTSFRDPLLTPGRSYHYRVSANRGREMGPDSVAVSATPVTGLVGRWDLEAGAVGRDASITRNHGRSIGAVQSVTGPSGSAIELDGKGHVSVPLNIGRWLSGSFTMTSWIRTTATGDNHLVYAPTIMGSAGQDIWDEDRRSLIGALDASGRIGVRLHWSGPDVTSEVAINDGRWRHVGITRDQDSGRIQIYIDGVLSSTGTAQTGYLYQRAFSIGRADQSRSGNYWRGGLDDVRIYDRILAAHEIAAIRDDAGPATPNQPPSVTLTAPSADSTFAAPAQITLSADASDADGAVRRVEFFADSTRIGESSSSPYRITWSAVPAGTWRLTARATDDRGDSTTSDPVTISVTSLREPENPVATVSGLDYRYYQGTWSLIPDFDALEAVATGSVDTVTLAPRLRDDDFGFRFSGYIDVPSDGTWTFFTSSDDGSRLSIGDQVVVDNDGAHATQERSGSIALRAGRHALRVDYFERAGDQVLDLRWEGPGVAKQVIAADHLLRDDSTGPPLIGEGSISREVWLGVSGTGIASIPLERAPDIADNLDRFETPTDWADDYATRVRGYLTAPATGSYTFWIASDDGGELWLASDGDAANRQRIASVPGWTSSREWSKYASQRSAAISLTAGQRYYIEALQKEGAGSDNLAVGWLRPGESGDVPSEVIPGSQLSPYAENGALPDGFVASDIGSPTPAGSAEHAAGSWTLQGAGADIWGTVDGFHFVHRGLVGDGSITARVLSLADTDPWAKAGVMVRETLAADSRHAMMVATVGNGTAFQRRTTTGGVSSHTAGSPAGAPIWVRLVREGDQVSGYERSDGGEWQLVRQLTLELGERSEIGLCVTSHQDGTLSAAVFDQVSVVAGPISSN